MPNEIEVIPGLLEQFRREPGLVVNLDGLDADMAGYAGVLAESQAFGQTLTSSTQAIMAFLGQVRQGIEAYKEGAGQMASTYDATQDRVTQTMANVTIRPPGPTA